MSCNSCSKIGFELENFGIIRKCESDYQTKIHEALLIKEHTPSLNRQLYAGGASFLHFMLKSFYIQCCFNSVLYRSFLKYFVICFEADW